MKFAAQPRPSGTVGCQRGTSATSVLPAAPTLFVNRSEGGHTAMPVQHIAKSVVVLLWQGSHA